MAAERGPNNNLYAGLASHELVNLAANNVAAAVANEGLTPEVALPNTNLVDVQADTQLSAIQEQAAQGASLAEMELGWLQPRGESKLSKAFSKARKSIADHKPGMPSFELPRLAPRRVLAGAVAGIMAVGSLAPALGEADTSTSTTGNTTPAAGTQKAAGNNQPGSGDKASQTDQKKPGAMNKFDYKLGGSVDAATKRVKTTNDEEFQHFVRETYAFLGHANDLKVSHDGNRMSSLKSFDKNASTDDIREATWLSAINSQSYRAGLWNTLHGRAVEAQVPESVSPKEQLNFIYKVMSSDDLKTTNIRMNGLYANGAIKADGSRYAKLTSFTDVRAVKIEANGRTAIVKVGGGSRGNEVVCLNLEELKNVKIVEETPPVTAHTPTVTPPTGGAAHTPEAPATTPKKRTVVTPKTTPKKPKTRIKIHPKQDKNTTPAGVPGENGGTPDVAGKGPAGQKPDANGFVPGEEHPATPAPKPTPAPLPNKPAPTAPAETGQDSGGTQAPSTNAGETAPTTDPDPQG